MIRINSKLLAFIENLYINKKVAQPILKHTYTSGSLILKQGTTSSHVYFIKQGITKVYYNEENGKKYIVEFLGKGEIIGEIEALKRAICLCNVEAITDTTLYSIPKSYFNDLITSNSVFSKLILDELADRIINTNSRSSIEQLYKIEYTLLHLIYLLDIEQINASKQDIAKYLGITIWRIDIALIQLKYKLNTKEITSEFQHYFGRDILIKLRRFFKDDWDLI